MRTTGYNEVRSFIQDFLSRKLAEQGRGLPDDFTDEYDLLLSGLIDSLGLLELVTALNEFAGREIDFEALDPEKMTVVGQLCEFVSAQCEAPTHND